MSEAVLASAPTGRAGRAAKARALALAVPGFLLGGALFSQYVGGLNPCEMCYWQRWPHAFAIVAAAAAFFYAAESRTARLLTALAALGIAISGAIGLFHAGVEAGWWEGLTTCTASGAMNLDDLLAAPIVRCDEVQWSLLGISMAGWNAILSLGGALGVAVLLGKRA